MRFTDINISKDIKLSDYYNKKITISILPLINYGLNQNEFLRTLEHIIYSELDKHS